MKQDRQLFNKHKRIFLYNEVPDYSKIISLETAGDQIEKHSNIRNEHDQMLVMSKTVAPTVSCILLLIMHLSFHLERITRSTERDCTRILTSMCEDVETWVSVIVSLRNLSWVIAKITHEWRELRSFSKIYFASSYDFWLIQVSFVNDESMMSPYSNCI